MLTTETDTAATLDIAYVRAQFPALAQTVNGHPAVFLDGPGGTQVPQRVIDAISNYLRRNNANTGGAYATSRNTDAMLAEARAAMADFLNCGADEVVFGPNMTTLTYAMSRAIGRDLGPGDEILVTRLDHDANVSPWLALEEKGVTIRWAEIHTRRLHARRRRPRGETQLQNQTRRDRLRLERGRHHQSRQRDRPPGPRRRRARLRRRRPLRPAWPDRCGRARLRLSGLLHLQILRPAHGSSLRQARASRSACVLTRCARSLTPSPTAGSGARSTTNASPASPPASTTSPISAAARDPEAATRRAAIVAAFEAIHRHEHALMNRLMAGLSEIPQLKIYGITDPSLLRLALSHARGACDESDGGANSAGPRHQAGRPRLLHLGWKLLRAEPDRAASTWKNPAASCASASCITTLRKKWIGCWRR